MAKTCYININTNPDNAVLGRKRRSNEVMQNSIPRYLEEKEEKEIPTTNYEKIAFEEEKELKMGKQLSSEEKRSLKAMLRKSGYIRMGSKTDPRNQQRYNRASVKY